MYYALNGNGEIIGISVESDSTYNFEFTGQEPFGVDYAKAFNFKFINGEWKINKPEIPQSFLNIDPLPMSPLNVYDRQVIIKEGPYIDRVLGTVTINITVQHFLNGEWIYEVNTKDYDIVLLADGQEFLDLNNLFNNPDSPIVFWDKVRLIVRSRISDGTVDRKISALN
jgi:hypothetical protein